MHADLIKRCLAADAPISPASFYSVVIAVSQLGGLAAAGPPDDGYPHPSGIASPGIYFTPPEPHGHPGGFGRLAGVTRPSPPTYCRAGVWPAPLPFMAPAMGGWGTVRGVGVEACSFVWSGGGFRRGVGDHGLSSPFSAGSPRTYPGGAPPLLRASWGWDLFACSHFGLGSVRHRPS